MKKMLALFLTMLLLVGCLEQEKAPEAEFIPEPSPAPLPELFVEEKELPACTVRYTNGVPEELFDSPAYRAAFALPAVISFENEPMTRGDEVRSFVETVEQGGSGELYYFAFSYLENWKEVYGEEASVEEAAPYRVYGAHFVADEGKVTKRSLFNHNWEEDFVWSEDSYAVEKLELSPWGVLCVEDESSSEPLGYPVISGYELYEDYGKRLELHESYISPIHYDGNRAFDVAEGKIDHWLELADDIASYEQYGGFWRDFPDGVLPREWLLDFMGRYFDLSETELDHMIRNNRFYDAGLDAIVYEGGRGGRSPVYLVQSWVYAGGGDLLSITYDACHPDTYEPLRGYRLTVRLLPDGSFRYRSLEELGDVQK